MSVRTHWLLLLKISIYIQYFKWAEDSQKLPLCPVGTTMMNKSIVEKLERTSGGLGLCPVERSETRDAKMVRNSMIWVAYAVTWCHGMSGPVLPQRATSGSVALLQFESVIVSVAHVVTESRVDTCGLGHHLKSYGCQRATLLLGPYQSE